MSEAAPHELGREEFDRLLAVLEREQQAMQLTRAQRISYRLYSVFLWGFILCLVSAFILAISSKEGDYTAVDKAGIACVVAGMVCLLGGIISLLLNLPLMNKIIRQRLVIRRLGISSASSALWRAHRKTKRWRIILGRFGLIIGILAFVFGVMVVFFGFGKGVSVWFGVGLGLLFLMFYVVSTGKEWLDTMSAQSADATQLKESMLSLRSSEGGAGSIAIPSEAIRQYSRIEGDQIARSRVRAITASAGAAKEEFSILSSNDVRKMKAGLGPEARLKVDEALDALMLQPRPPDAQADSGTGFLRRRVNGTEFELVYAIDDTARQLKLMSLRPAEVGSAAHD